MGGRRSMLRSLAGLTLIATTAAMMLVATPATVAAQSIRELFKRVTPSVVVIRAKGRDVEGPGGLTRFNETGSGVLVSRDGRPSGEMLRHAVTAGLLGAGCTVEDVGIAPTPSCGFAVRFLQAAGAIQITASHNPAPWNGLKMFGPDGAVLSAEGGAVVRGLYESGEFPRAAWDGIGTTRVPPDVLAVEARQLGTGRPLETYHVRGLDSSFLSHTTFELGAIARGYATSRDVWTALDEHRGLAVVDSLVVQRRDQFGFNVMPSDFKITGFYADEGERFEPVPVDVLDKQTGRRTRLTIIGVLSDSAPFEMSGISSSQSTLAAAFPGRAEPTIHYFTVAPGVDTDAAAQRLEAAFLANGLEAETIEKVVDDYVAGNRTFNRLIQGFMALGLVVGVAALGVISARSVVERLHRDAYYPIRVAPHAERRAWFSMPASTRIRQRELLAFTQQLAIQNAGFGVRANVILPGLIDTPMAVDTRARASGRSRAEIAAGRDARVPLRHKMGTAWDVANAALFLASDEANFITGVALPVDGGALVHIN